MGHIPETTIHGYRKRGLAVTVDVETTLQPQDLTGTVFQFGSRTKTGLTPQAGGSGLEIPVTLTAADLDVTAGKYRWECRAVIAGELTPLAVGDFIVDAEPTPT